MVNIYEMWIKVILVCSTIMIFTASLKLFQNSFKDENKNNLNIAAQ